jgi:hypothetical protein
MISASRSITAIFSFVTSMFFSTPLIRAATLIEADNTAASALRVSEEGSLVNASCVDYTSTPTPPQPKSKPRPANHRREALFAAVASRDRPSGVSKAKSWSRCASQSPCDNAIRSFDAPGTLNV